MKILLVTAYFPPEIGSAPNLFHQLGAEFVRRGHSVTVLTGFPTYNVDSANLSELYRRENRMAERLDGMNIVRIRTMGLPRQIPVLRGISQLAMMWSFYRAGVSNEIESDVILVYSPPLFLGLTALALRRRNGGAVIVNVQDLFPQSAIDLRVLRSRFLIRLFRVVEGLIYRRSDAITVHSSGNRRHVVQRGCSEDRAHEIPNLVDTKGLTPGNRMSAFRTRYGIPEKAIIASFAGVIGLSQDLDVVIDAADELRDLSEVQILIVGDGLEKPRLMRKAEGRSNVRFFPMLQKREYAELLDATDIGLATLRQDVRTPVVPSKILSIMASGRPVLASMPLEGDAPRLIEEAKCGRCVPPGEPDRLAEAIRSMVLSPQDRKDMGENGRRYVEQHCSLEACAMTYEALFEKLIRTSRITEGIS